MSNFFTQPVDDTGSMIDPDDYFDPAPAARRAYQALDLASIHAGAKALRDVLSTGGRIIVGLAIHCETLADVTRRHDVLSALAAIDPQLRRYIMVRLCHVPTGFPRFHLEEQIRLLGKVCERVGVELNLDDNRSDMFSHPRVWAFGYALPPAAQIETLRTNVNRLRARSNYIHKAGKLLAVSSSGGNQIVEVCRASRADYVSALGLWPLEQAPRGVELPRTAAAG